jgi:hopanoid C-2 methylase
MRYPAAVKNRRRVLCVFPAYTPSFGTFAHAYKLMRVAAFMPPQGLLAIAAYLPEAWDVRFVDENISRATAEDFGWADAVFVSGMHIQRKQIDDICARAHATGKPAALGGPSVSGAPEMYPAFDYLHQGELGDATDRLIALLDEGVARPAAQVRLETKERLPLSDFPTPAYAKAKLSDYLIGTFQFSSGCPYRCEFCDIPALYGRQPRLKTAEQLTTELDAIVAEKGHPSTVYFVDDNFIGNKKATREMLPHLIAWQKSHDYPLDFACEATLNIAKQPEILKLMREAGFVGIFVGIETPELDALKHMRKEHNASLPMYESIETLNSYGLEVSSGIILGLDTDTPQTIERLIEFIERSKIPMLTINLLQALPKTPLHERLERAGRIVEDPTLESNVRFLRPYDDVLASWRRAIAYAYTPERLFARFRHQVDKTYVNRMKLPARGKLTGANLKRGLWLLVNSVVELGIRADYRRDFWHAFLYAMRRGQIDGALGMAFMSHHLIKFTREALSGAQNASFYSAKAREAEETREAA